MAFLEEISQWESGIYQIELTDPVRGGDDGIANIPTKMLANRTGWLRDRFGRIPDVSAITVSDNASIANDDVIGKHLIINIGVSAKNVSIPLFNSMPDNTVLSVQVLGSVSTNNVRVILQTGNFITRLGSLSEFIMYPGESLTGYKVGNDLFVFNDQTGLINCGKMEIQYFQPLNSIELAGQLVSRQEFYRLFKLAESSMIPDATWLSGYTNNGKFSSGNGTTTFRVPDLRGAFLRALDNGRGLDYGRLNATLQFDALKSHGHAYRDWYYPEASAPDGPNKESMPTGYNNKIGSGATDRDNTIVLFRDSNTGNTGATETRPVNIAYPIYMHY